MTITPGRSSLDLFDEVLAKFDACLASVTPDMWTWPTPCTEWDVAALVRHVIQGDIPVAGGFEGSVRDDTPIGDDLLASWRHHSDRLRDAFAAPGGLDGDIRRGSGLVPASVVIRQKIAGYAVHTWDLARAVGADEVLGDDVVEVAWSHYDPTRGAQRGPNFEQHFDAPPETEPENVTLQERLLLAVGRHP